MERKVQGPSDDLVVGIRQVERSAVLKKAADLYSIICKLAFRRKDHERVFEVTRRRDAQKKMPVSNIKKTKPRKRISSFRS